MYPSPVNITGPVELLNYVNVVTSGLFGPVLLGVLFLIVFVGTKQFLPIEKCLMVSLFAVLLPAIFMQILGLISGWYVFFIIMVLLLVVFYVGVHDRSSY